MGFFDWFRKGFTNARQAKIKDIEALSSCSAEASYCAWVWGLRYHDPIRIAVQHINLSIDHAQAEAQIKGVWTPLTPYWSEKAGRIAVVPFHRHFDIEPYRTVPLREWVLDQIQYAEEIEG